MKRVKAGTEYFTELAAACRDLVPRNGDYPKTAVSLSCAHSISCVNAQPTQPHMEGPDVSPALFHFNLGKTRNVRVVRPVAQPSNNFAA